MKTLTSSRGFTLIEMMLAILIFGILIATVTGAFNFVFSSVDVIKKNLVVQEMAKSCINRISTDLASIYVTPALKYNPPGYTDDPDPYRFKSEVEDTQEGSFSTVRFTSHSHLPLGNTLPAGIAEIVYYVLDDGAGHNYLFRSDRIFFEDPLEKTGYDPVVCENVKSLKLTFIDQEGEIHESWDSEGDAFEYATPRAVDITLEIGDDEDSFYFSSMVMIPVYRDKVEDKE